MSEGRFEALVGLGLAHLIIRLSIPGAHYLKSTPRTVRHSNNFSNVCVLHLSAPASHTTVVGGFPVTVARFCCTP